LIECTVQFVAGTSTAAVEQVAKRRDRLVVVVETDTMSPSCGSGIFRSTGLPSFTGTTT
jgi:hypothetical protein